MRAWLIALAVLALSGSAAFAQSAESTAWVRAQQSCDGLRAYIRDYPQGRFIARARTELPTRCPPPPRTETKKAVPTTQTPDRCLQARADWAGIQNSTDITVLRAFRDSAPAACAVQRAQAQSRIETLEAEARRLAEARLQAEAKRRLWNGVPQFEGTWVVASGTGCIGSPFSFRPNGSKIQVLSSDGSVNYENQVENTNPPTLVGPSGHRLVIQSDGTIRDSGGDGGFHCYLRRQ